MGDKALDVRHGRGPGEHASEVLFELSAHDGDAVLGDRPGGLAIAHRQGSLQQVLYLAGKTGARMILLQVA